jgi:hypothetical protein
MVNVSLFGQILTRLDRYSFKKIVAEHQSDKHSKGINSWTHLVSMLFCQLANANSLRDISNGLCSAAGNLNHYGVARAPKKSTLGYINKHRSWEVFRDYYFALLAKFSSEMEFTRIKFKSIKQKILLLDSTVISLCLSAFDWAHYRESKGALKLHMLLDYDGCLPKYILMTDGRKSDVSVAQTLKLPKDSLVIADRAYIDFKMLYRWHMEKTNFVIRLKKNISYKRIKENPLPDDAPDNILIDEVILLDPDSSGRNYPERLRRIAVWSEEHKMTIEIITNQMTWTAEMISELYKARWSIEIFFKEVKSLLKIKSFVGTSENAVLIQIWTAMISILILKYLKAIAKHDWCLSNLVGLIRMTLFAKIDLQMWLDNPVKTQDPIPISDQMVFRW